MALIRAEYLEEGDMIVIDEVVSFVADIRENARMNGIWVECTTDVRCDGLAIFFQGDDMVTVTTTVMNSTD